MLSSALSSEFGKTGWVGVETEAEIGEECTKQKFKVSSSTQLIVLCDIKKKVQAVGGKTTGLRASDFQSIWKEIKDVGFILEVGGTNQ